VPFAVAEDKLGAEVVAAELDRDRDLDRERDNDPRPSKRPELLPSRLLSLSLNLLSVDPFLDSGPPKKLLPLFTIVPALLDCFE